MAVNCLKPGGRAMSVLRFTALFTIDWLLMTWSWSRARGWNGVWFCARHVHHTWRCHRIAEEGQLGSPRFDWGNR
jgi:hypothetical protein